MTTGASPTAVTELILSSVGAKAVLAISSQISVIIAPPRKHAGIMISGFAVFKMPLMICGTAIPTKDIGPAKAVTVADKRLDARIRITRNAFILTPMFLAYASPS